jgi:hypothetical protein
MHPRRQRQDEHGQPDEDQELFGKFPASRAGFRYRTYGRGFHPVAKPFSHIGQAPLAAESDRRFTVGKGTNRAMRGAAGGAAGGRYSRAKSM